MQYKTLTDIDRIVSLGKSEEVIDKFIDSYLTGEAIKPYTDAEANYAYYKSLPDVEDIPEIIDSETLEVLQEAVSPNTERDESIAELEIEYPYLIKSEQTFTNKVTGIDVNGDDIVESIPDVIPSVEQRRPVITIDPIALKSSCSKEIKAKELKKLQVIDSGTIRLLITLIQKLLEKDVIAGADFTADEIALYQKALSLKGQLW